MKIEVPTEEQEQIALMKWAEIMSGKYPCLKLLFHIPNGGKRGIREATRFKAAGVKAGVPDLFLPVAVGAYRGLFIELKRTKGGNPSGAQLRWARDLVQQGYAVALCRGWKSASETIMDYLEGKI